MAEPRSTTGGAAAAAPLFNPHFDRCGFYPADVVDALPGLGNGPKRVYRRLVWHAGLNGRCWPSVAVLAAALGKSARQVQYDLRKLEHGGFIRVVASRGRKSNTYEFLQHSSVQPQRQFDPTMQPIAGFERASTMQSIAGFKTGSFAPTMQDLVSQPCNGLHPETKGNPKENTSSSMPIASTRETTTNPPDGWNPSAEGLEETQRLLAGHFWGGAPGRLPDPNITRAVLVAGRFRSLADVRDYFEDLGQRVEPRRVRSLGFYAEDAKHWPQRRRPVEEPEPIRAALTPDLPLVLAEPATAPAEPVPEPVATTPPPIAPRPKPSCGRCRDGTVMREGRMVWCACPKAAKLRAEKPETCDEYNRALEAVSRRFGGLLTRGGHGHSGAMVESLAS